MAAFSSALTSAMHADAQSASPALEESAPPPKPAGLPPRESDWSGARTLQGNTFQRPVFVDSAFTGGFFGDTSRLGFAPIHAGPGEFQAAILYSTVDFGIPLGRGVQIAFDGNSHTVMGADRRSTLAVGGSFGVEALPGLRVGVARSQRHGYEVTLHGSVILAYDAGIEPANLIAMLADRVGGDPQRQRCLLRLDLRCAFLTSMPVKEAISNKTTSFGGALALDYAQAFGRHFGVQASGELAVEGSSFTAVDPETREKTTTSSAPFTVGAGVAPSYNFYPDAPLSLQAEYAFDYRASSPKGNATHAFTNNFALGLYYTGRRDLQLGLTGAASFRDATTTLTNAGITGKVNANAYTGGLSFYYYF